MPTVQTLVTFLLAGLVLVVIPGPSVLFIVGRALAYGRRAVFTSVAGNTTGALFVGVLVACGLGVVAAASAEVFVGLKLFGAAYLIYLGVRMVRERGKLVSALAEASGPVGRRLYLQGVVVGATNPKVLVLFAAILPQFVDPQAGNTTSQMLVLGSVFALLASTTDIVWGLVAGWARGWFATSPARLRRVGGVGGLMVITMGVGLALTGRKD